MSWYKFVQPLNNRLYEAGSSMADRSAPNPLKRRIVGLTPSLALAFLRVDTIPSTRKQE